MNLSISERLNMLLTAQKVNRQEFMEKIQISKSRFYRILNGNENCITPSDLINMSRYLNVSCDYLLFGDNDSLPDQTNKSVTENNLITKSLILKNIDRLSPEDMWTAYLFIQFLNNRH